MSKMMTMRRTTVVGLAGALLITGAFAGVLGAQVIDSLLRRSFVNTGLFTVGAGEGVNFHIALDDARTGPPARVLMQLFNQNGAAVAREEVLLAPGQSKTLAYRQPGRYRAHAQIMEPDERLGSRRIVLGTVEIFPLDPGLCLTSLPRFACSADDGSGNGRIPD